MLVGCRKENYAGKATGEMQNGEWGGQGKRTREQKGMVVDFKGRKV